jgi:hypothetical protein
MRLSYDGIEFKILKVENFSVTAIYDSMASLDYLYDEVKLDVVCILNRDVTDKSEFPDSPNIGTTIIGGINQVPASAHRPWNNLKVVGDFIPSEQPVNQGGTNDGLTRGNTGPAATLVDLFRRLRQPRRQLRVWMDSNPDLNLKGKAAEETILLSPLPGMSVDAAGGPICSYLQPMPIYGGNSTLALRLQFETHIPGCTDDDAPLILSNRWSFSVGAENDFAIHRIDGEVRFRMDLLHKRGFTADQFRRQFLHPIPVGFRRESPVVTLLPSGDGVKYSLTDRQMPLNFPGGIYYGLNRIEIVESRAYKAPIGIMSQLMG